MASPSFSRIKYDVFISFRGTDIRSGFLGHLKTRLQQKQINAYLDDKLERGEEISSSLFRAIEESHISLIIFSSNYASSKWCLEELVKIMECRDKLRQIVIPIFYHIDPSDVRHQRGSYADVFAQHDKNCKEEGTEATRSLVFHMSNFEDLFLDSQVFAKMRKLKFRKIFSNYYRWGTVVHLPQGLTYLPSELILLHWPYYPLKSLPSTFCPKNLVELDLRCSRVEKLWDGVMPLANLKKINLDDSLNLLQLPDFSMANNLEEVSLSGCKTLLDVHPSILSLHKLEKLILSFCKKLTSLSSDILLKSLLQLRLDGCSELKEFSVTSENMRELDLTETSFEELPLSLRCLGNLQILSLGYCKSLTHLPSNLVDLRSLYYLDITGCIQLGSLPELPPSVQIVLASNCTSLETIIVAANPLNTNLRDIHLENCMKLDGQLLNVIGRHFKLKLINDAFKQTLGIGYIQPGVMYPGSKVPDWFVARTSGASIAIAPQLEPQTFIFCIILPRNIRYHSIIVHCVLEDNGKEFRRHPTPIYGDILLGSDHVFLFCDNDINEWIEGSRSSYQPKISFEFSFEEPDMFFEFSAKGRHKEIVIRECGVYPLYASASQHNFIEEKELEACEIFGLGSRVKKTKKFAC